MRKLVQAAAGLCALLALGACAATSGNDTGSPDSKAHIYPIAEVDPEAVEAKTGLADGETITVDSAITGPRMEERGEAETMEFRDAIITLRDENDNPTITLQIDRNLNGRADDKEDIFLRASVTPDDQVIDETTGRVMREAGQINIGGQTATFNRDRNRSDALPQTVIYVPQDKAQEMYAGMMAYEQNSGFGEYAVFGQRTSGADLDRQRQLGGTATYAGIAHAAVDHLDQNGTTAKYDDDSSRRGIYHGTASGTIDFGTNNVSILATMDETTNTSFAPTGGGQLEMRMTGTVGRGGTIAGDTSFTGADVQGVAPEGEFKGAVFGPNAETVGGTFYGYEPRRPDDSRSIITGGVLMNQTNRTQR